jgi:hypothetical protein
MLKKYTEKASEWIGFGWDVASPLAVDVVFYGAYDWVADPEVEHLAQGHLKPGQQIHP